MNDSDSLLPSTATAVPKRPPSTAAGRYKLWALSAVLLLALWSMLTGIVTLKRSALRRFDGDLAGPALDDLDILVRIASRLLCLVNSSAPRHP